MRFRIAEFRKKKKLSQTQLAQVSGVSRATIAGLESGAITVTTTGTIEKLSNALKVPVSKILLP